MRDTGPVEKALLVVRQAHHEQNKVNNFNSTSVHPELVEGCQRGFQQPTSRIFKLIREVPLYPISLPCQHHKTNLFH